MSNLTLDDSLDAGQAMAVLDQHLHGRAGKPVAVGFSGGGDSLFLLKMAVDWGRRHHRPVLAITVDHRLQPESRDWVSWCADKAWALGADFVGRAWEGPKPDTGLSAAARRARHELLAQETRRVGASVLLLGQTLDDLFEAELMALEGSSVGMPRTWSPSPVWPEGREVFLLRPLLSLRRAAIRRELVRENWQWIDDPANESAVSLRARARSRLARDPSTQDLSVSALPPMPTPPAQVSGGASGGLELNWPISPTVLGMACLSAGGGSRPPRRDQLTQLWEELDHCDHFCATLSGARIDKADGKIRIVRNAGDRLRAHGVPLDLQEGIPVVWDGRFAVQAGFFGQLCDAERTALKAFSPMARRSLPAVVDGSGRVTCPVLALDSRVQLDDLVLPRFRAACGYIREEA